MIIAFFPISMKTDQFTVSLAIATNYAYHT